MKSSNTPVSQNSPEQKNNNTRISFQDFKIYNRSIVMKPIWYRQKAHE